MLSRLRKLLPFQSHIANRGEPSTEQQMPFITGSQPWLKPYILAALAHPPNPPSLNAHYLQAVSPVSSRRELTVYDGHFIIAAVLSQSAASLLDADEEDTGVTTRNLLGHVLAPISVIVVPDMTTTPPTATLLIKEVRVFADRVHQRPVGRVPLVYTDPEVCDALRAIVGRQLASYATATVLERADRAAEIQIEQPPETDTFFEKLLNDPSVPPPGMLGDSETFAMPARRGTVVGGGAVGDDDPEALAIIPENPTPPKPDKSKKPQEATPPDSSQPNQRDPDWDINFTQDPAEGGGSDSVGADALPQTQHFAIDDDEDDDDNDDDVDHDDDNDDDGGDYDPRDDENDDGENESGAEGRKTVGEQRIQEIVGTAQEDTLDGQPESSLTGKRRVQTGDQSPSGEHSPHKKSAVTTAPNTNKSVGKSTEEIRQKDKAPHKRAHGMETRSGKVKQEGHNRPDLPSSKTVPENVKSTPSGAPDIAASSKSPQGSPGRITRSSARNIAAASSRRTGTDDDRASKSRTIRGDEQETGLASPRRSPRIVQMSTPPDEHEAGLVSPRRSPRIVQMSTPPRRPRGTDEAKLDPSKDGTIAQVSLHSPLRRSPRARKRGKGLAYKEEESEQGERDEDDHDVQPEAATETGTERDADTKERPMQSADKQKRDGQDVSEPDNKNDPSSNVNRSAVDSVERVERGTKRKATEISSPDNTGFKNPQDAGEEPSSYSPEPFLDKIKAEIEEMKRFRDRIDKNPEGYKTYPDGFLPSAKPGKHSARRRLMFPEYPPPPQKVNRVLDVPESAPM